MLLRRCGTALLDRRLEVWGRSEAEGLGLQSDVGCRCRVITRTGGATVASAGVSPTARRPHSPVETSQPTGGYARHPSPARRRYQRGEA